MKNILSTWEKSQNILNSRLQSAKDLYASTRKGRFFNHHREETPVLQGKKGIKGKNSVPGFSTAPSEQIYEPVFSLDSSLVENSDKITFTAGAPFTQDQYSQLLAGQQQLQSTLIDILASFRDLSAEVR